MTTITPTRAWKVADKDREQIAEMLRGKAMTAIVLLSQEGGVGKVL